jgi:hypothetical protein
MAAGHLTFLIDTNVLITAEPRDDGEIEPGAEAASELLRRITEQRHLVVRHPASVVDFERDSDRTRRQARLLQQRKYPALEAPPPVPEEWQHLVGEVGDNDHVDLLLLAALARPAANFLVSEDQGLRRRASQLGLDDRVATIDEAVAHLRTLAGESGGLPPAVKEVPAHSLDTTDPIFVSLRAAYPDFDGWFARVRAEHRRALIISGSDGTLDALSLVKEEPDGNDAQMPGRILKISTLKVANPSGQRFGELLLKALLRMAHEKCFDGLYVTVFADDQPALVALLNRFGFAAAEHRTPRGEHIFGKRLATKVNLQGPLPEDAFEFHREFGPPALHPSRGDLFVVPIQRRFSARLFPDASPQTSFLAPEGFGNSILKAYLSSAKSRSMGSGDIVGFYESSDGGPAPARGVFAIGVVEEMLASSSPEEVAQAVGTRTVYSMDDIRTMCQEGEVLAILFRHDRTLRQDIPLRALLEHEALTSWPQSIVRVKKEGEAWLRTQIQQ